MSRAEHPRHHSADRSAVGERHGEPLHPTEHVAPDVVEDTLGDARGEQALEEERDPVDDGGRYQRDRKRGQQASVAIPDRVVDRHLDDEWDGDVGQAKGNDREARDDDGPAVRLQVTAELAEDGAVEAGEHLLVGFSEARLLLGPLVLDGFRFLRVVAGTSSGLGRRSHLVTRCAGVRPQLP